MSESILDVIALAVRDRRKQLGISQEELGARAGLHRTYIGAIERSERNVSVVVLARLASALDCKPSDLVTAP